MASQAEARLRAKTEALLREIHPDARIVHEFAMGGVRMDVAAITTERLVTVEIKSELDTLDRLPNQLRFACALGGEVWVVFAPKWRTAMKARAQSQDMAQPIVEGGRTTYADNPIYIPELWRCVELTEDDATGELVTPDRYGVHPLERARHPHRYIGRDRYCSRRLLDLLLKPELYALAQPFGAKSKHDVPTIAEIAHDNLTGAQIRRGVLAALRARTFGWTCDAPVRAEAA